MALLADRSPASSGRRNRFDRRITVSDFIMDISEQREGSLTLAELVAVEDYGLSRESGSTVAWERPILGAHSIEHEIPTRFLASGWVMLSTGIRLKDNPAEQRDLIRELDEAGIAGLGFGVDIAFKQVPRALLEEAEARDFPVFRVPGPTAFRDLISYVNRSLLSSEMRAVQRLSSIQRFLIDSLKSRDPRSVILERLARILDASVYILPVSGKAPGSHVGPDDDRLRERLGQYSPQPAQELAVDSWNLFVTPITDADESPHGWLIVASRRLEFLNSLTRPVTQAAAPLLIAAESLKRTEFEQQRAVRDAVLEALCSGGSRHDLDVARTRARSIGFLDGVRCVLALVGRPSPGEGFDPPHAHWLVESFEEWAERAGSPYLLYRRPDEIAVMAQEPADGSGMPAFLERLTERDPEIVIGVGRAFDDLEEVQQSMLDARQAIRRLRQPRRASARILDFESFDLGSLLMSETAEERIKPKLREIFDVFRENPQLKETLVVYFECGMDVNAAATAVHLHANSLRYRLRRIEELLDRSLKDPATITSLYLALSSEGAVTASTEAGDVTPEELDRREAADGQAE